MHNRNSPYEAWYNLTQGTPRPGVPPNNLQSSSPQNSLTPNHCSSPNGLQANGLPPTVLPPNVLPPNVLPANMSSNAYYMQQQNEAQMWHHHAMPSHPITPPGYHQVEYQDFGIHHQVANHLHNMQYGYLNEENHQLPSPPTTVSGSEMSSPGGTNGNITPPTLSSQSSSRTPRPRQDYEWINKPSYQSQPNPESEKLNGKSLDLAILDFNGRTRTEDAYRTVYPDYVKKILEREYQCVNKYISQEKKAQLAELTSLTPRQIKIWFQNRRSKDRKTIKNMKENLSSQNGLNPNFLEYGLFSHPVYSSPYNNAQNIVQNWQNYNSPLITSPENVLVDRLCNMRIIKSETE